jgi:hypothetical protein
MRHEDFSMLEFRRYWDQGIPVIVSHVKFQGTWDPAYFAKAHKDKKVTLVNCETGKTKSCTVAAFFIGKLPVDTQPRQPPPIIDQFIIIAQRIHN